MSNKLEISSLAGANEHPTFQTYFIRYVYLNTVFRPIANFRPILTILAYIA